MTIAPQHPHTVAGHDRWTPVAGTPFELYQASGAPLDITRVAGTTPAIAFYPDAATPLQLRLTEQGIAEIHHEYGVREYPNKALAGVQADGTIVEMAPGPTVHLDPRGREYALERAEHVNERAAGPEGYLQRVRHADLVHRTRVVYTDGSEYAGPWLPPAAL